MPNIACFFFGLIRDLSTAILPFLNRRLTVSRPEKRRKPVENTATPQQTSHPKPSASQKE